ncbi:M20/M25/M40 family metallo-hydrolase [Streptococcus iniae]|uniref:Peptidase M20 n=1 Tax=Streptococcus iniae TaxID=1346 RepID=A0ABM5QIY8_STRIN|nr:M20/M25/M40 family metallo-hydrolase [Streptococcus iniae]AGM99375.1 peptidase dimerization domain protein [Streptococcus iniae SF1]AHY16308.1 peptidase M20 [Streptococcus iniae]AHY18171.1 peptidase M20 [Streptococcus iniae]AJG26458.1 peptidase M20 [Streptococcus iniae]APD32333.1 peptidase M20 [Streptococcus iniae]
MTKESNNRLLLDSYWNNSIVQSNLRKLQELIAQPSIFAQDIGLKEAATYLKSIFEAAGAQVILDETYKAPFLLASFNSHKASAKTIIFYNHYDTVPADSDQLWTSDPFSLTIRDDFMYARGVDDDKGHIIARLSAVENYLATYGELPVNIIFIMEGAEESASVDLEHYLESYKDKLDKADLLIWEQGIRNEKNQLELTGGNKGIVTFDIEVDSATSDIHSKYGGVIESATWYLIEALSSLREKDGSIAIKALYDHCVQPNQRELELIESYALENEVLLEKLYGLQLPMLQSDRKSFLKRYYFEPSLTIQGLQSGYLGQGVKTIIPSKASAKMEIRLVPGLKPKEVFEAVKEYLYQQGFNALKITYTLGEESYRSDLTSSEIEHLIAVLKKHYDKGLSLLPTSAGTGPMHTVFQALEVPMVSFGLGNNDSRDHAGDENVSIDDYCTHIHLIEELIKSYE